jgi:hypothetical protein
VKLAVEVGYVGVHKRTFLEREVDCELKERETDRRRLCFLLVLELGCAF